MEHIKMSDVTSAAGVARILNKLNDEIAELETQNDEYNNVINAHNKAVDKHNDGLVKKGA